MSQTRLVLVYQFLTLGGVEVVVQTWLKEYLRRGVDARVLFLASWGGEALFENLADQVIVQPDLIQVADFLRRSNPDWIISVDTPAILPVARQVVPRARLAYEVHSPYPATYAIVQDRDLMAGVSGIIVPSTSQRELIRDRLAYRLPIEVVRNPLPDVFFEPVDVPNTFNRPIVAWVGRLDSLKNWRGFVDLAQQLRRQIDAEFWMVGGLRSPKAEQDLLFEAIKSAGLIDRFCWFPAINHQDMPRFYRSVGQSGGCLVSTSWGESFGLAVLEAMGSACPVVAPETIGIKDLIRHGETGWLYPPVYIDRACQLVLDSFQNTDLRQAIIENAARFARTFTPEAAISQHLEILANWSSLDHCTQVDQGGLKIADIQAEIQLQELDRLNAVAALMTKATKREPITEPGQIEATLHTQAGVQEQVVQAANTHYDVICFPIIEWEHRFQRPQQLANQFARHGHRIFYLGLTFHDRSSQVEWRQVAERIFQIQLPGPTQLDRFTELLASEAQQQCLRALNNFCRQAGISDAICLIQLPFWMPLALGLREMNGWKVVYDCMDEHDGLTILQPERLADEARLARTADLVVTSSKKLLHKHTEKAARCLLVPNAADFDHFNQPAQNRPLDNLPRPVIGYYGAIMDWFDPDIVREAAMTRPDWSFVLIGNVDTPSVEPLQHLPNVHFLGEQPYHHLPAYLQQFDVCLIPFKLTPIVQSTNPVKFYEYLSAGKPVVSVPMPELMPYQELFYAARDAREFVVQIETALREDSPDRIAARTEWARQQTWQARYTALAHAIQNLRG